MSRSTVFTSFVVALVVAFAPAAAALPSGTEVRTYRGNLNDPVDMAWVRGTKKIFFTEKNTGRIRVLAGRRLLSRPCVNLGVSNNSEQGALGITLHPSFKKNHFLYVYYTDSSPVVNRVARFTVRNNRCRNKKVIISMDAAAIHNGGQLEFAGGKLYISVGEVGDPANAQDTTNRLGKILRVNPNGSIPDGNPFGNAVWSYGHRNPFGLARKPGTSKIYETENGPQCDDEMNVIVKGRNYGWGNGYDCGSAGVGPNPKPPEVRWSNVIVPTDLGWYRGRLKSIRGLLGVDYGEGRLHHFLLNDRGTQVKRDRIIYNGNSPLYDVEQGPGGWVYLVAEDAIKRLKR